MAEEESPAIHKLRLLYIISTVLIKFTEIDVEVLFEGLAYSQAFLSLFS
jgi:hypothetical protein